LERRIAMADSTPLNLRRTLYFVVLAEELHFGRAAARLSMAQPGLSQQIKILETELGVQLLERGGRTTRLTAAGELLYEEGAQLLHDADDLMRRLQTRPDGRTGRLTIGYSRSTQHLEMELVREFRELHSDLEVSTSAAWTALNVELLRSHNADVVFVRPPIDEPGIEALTLFSDELVLVLPEDHPLANRASITVRDVADEPVLLSPRRNAPGHYDRLVSQIWGERSPRVVLEETDDEQRLKAVADGVGISLLEHQRALNIRPQGVTIRRFAAPVPTCFVGVAWHQGDRNHGVALFIDFCRQRHASDIADLAETGH
jgi:DNA-binding transcriptional LysR family regulator